MDSRNAELMTGTVVRGLKREQGRILIDIEQEGIPGQLQADLVIGAEGDRSLTARQLGGLRKESDHYCAGIRTYYEGVSGFHEKNFIELHFLRDTLPGYLWIFPLTNGGANVGIGMLSSAIARRRTDLKDLLEKSLQQPSLRERFSHARRTDPMRGWGLPLGSKKRKLSGDGFLLTGDAGSLIDPFTGEGIGNAMISGRIAAETAVSAIQSDRFDGGFLERYDRAVYAELWEELRLSRTLQRLSGFGWLFNFVVNRAAKNTALRESITAMFDDMALRGDMGKPSFYLRLLFSGNEKRS
jgi:flavin-dependent dehydrogenase